MSFTLSATLNVMSDQKFMTAYVHVHKLALRIWEQTTHPNLKTNHIGYVCEHHQQIEKAKQNFLFVCPLLGD